MRASFRWSWLVLPLVVWGCAQGQQEQTAEAPPGDISPEEVRTLVMEEIHAVGDSISVQNPKTGQQTNLRFVAVHEGVMLTPGGRQMVCVDFTAPDGVVFDVDYYLSNRNQAWFVTDVAVHKVGPEDVQAPADRQRLGDVQ